MYPARKKVKKNKAPPAVTPNTCLCLRFISIRTPVQCRRLKGVVDYQAVYRATNGFILARAE